jgi:hypothetical protein
MWKEAFGLIKVLSRDLSVGTEETHVKHRLFYIYCQYKSLGVYFIFVVTFHSLMCN